MALKFVSIDGVVDQTIGFATDRLGGTPGIQVGTAVTMTLAQVAVPGAGSTSEFNGYLKGIITGITTDSSAGDFGTTLLMSRLFLA